MSFISLLSNLLPVTLAGLLLGAGLPALFAIAMRLSAGRTEQQEDGTVVQTQPASGVARAASTVLFAVIVGVIVLGILWVAKDFLYHSIGFDLLGAAKKK